MYTPAQGGVIDLLRVDRHPRSGHKLVALFGGFGGASCSKPYCWCNWNRTKTQEALSGSVS
jgi:hypothetical protein